MQEGRRHVVTGASEDGSLGRRRGKKNARLEKKDRHIRSAWGVVKRAMHLQDPAALARERLGTAPADHRTKRGCP
jgi:ribosomal protein L19E